MGFQLKMKTFQQFCEEKERKQCELKEIAKKAKIDISNICMKQLKMGMEVEKEHDKEKDIDVIPGHDKSSIMKIAVAHLREDPIYYTKLKKIEGKH